MPGRKLLSHRKGTGKEALQGPSFETCWHSSAHPQCFPFFFPPPIEKFPNIMAGLVSLSMSETHGKKDKAKKKTTFSYELAQILFLEENSIFIHIINSSSLFSVIITANPSHIPYPETCLSLASNADVMLFWRLEGPVTALRQLQTLKLVHICKIYRKEVFHHQPETQKKQFSTDN